VETFCLPTIAELVCALPPICVTLLVLEPAFMFGSVFVLEPVFCACACSWHRRHSPTSLADWVCGENKRSPPCCDPRILRPLEAIELGGRPESRKYAWVSRVQWRRQPPQVHCPSIDATARDCSCSGADYRSCQGPGSRRHVCCLAPFSFRCLRLGCCRLVKVRRVWEN